MHLYKEGATDAGHEVELMSLNKIEVKGCIGCNACCYGKPCIQKDGFNLIGGKKNVSRNAQKEQRD